MYKVYCDFDATVTDLDVWASLFQKYGKPLAFDIWQEFAAKRMTASECIRVACSTVEGLSREEAEQLFREHELREGFKEFVEFCKRGGIDLKIISDGFTAYIRPILDEHQIDLEYFANHIEVGDEGTLEIDFKYGRESCRYCASCKCGHILTSSADEDTIVYIGDGYSDVCPVRMSDVVFARDTLLQYCSKHGIPHHPFHTFHEIAEILETYINERPKYRRQTAHHRRQELIMRE